MRCFSMLFGLLLLATSTGCVPVLIGGAFYADAKKKEVRQKFMADFQQTNTEREKNGLEPLDLCSEQYKFDRSWAMQNAECKDRIKRYEAGDKAALRYPEQDATSPSVGSSGYRALSCDVRIVQVSDGAIVATASGQCSKEKLSDLAKALAAKLQSAVMVKGESIAVVSLCNRANSDCGKSCADEFADKLAGALHQTGWFEVKERIELRSVLQEKDLEAAEIVKNTAAREKIGNVRYIVIGGVTAS